MFLKTDQTQLSELDRSRKGGSGRPWRNRLEIWYSREYWDQKSSYNTLYGNLYFSYNFVTKYGARDDFYKSPRLCLSDFWASCWSRGPELSSSLLHGLNREQWLFCVVVLVRVNKVRGKYNGRRVVGAFMFCLKLVPLQLIQLKTCISAIKVVHFAFLL